MNCVSLKKIKISELAEILKRTGFVYCSSQEEQLLRCVRKFVKKYNIRVENVDIQYGKYFLRKKRKKRYIKR